MILKPCYNLTKLQKLIGDSTTRHITHTSIKEGFKLGFSETEIVDVVISLKSVNFYKTMPYHHSPTIWQDVYKTIAKKIKLYIKLQESPIDRGVIISFKEDTEGG